MAGMATAGAALAACQPQIVTVEVEKIKEVEKTVEVIKEVVTTVEVSKPKFEGELRVMPLVGPPVEPVCELLSAALTGQHPDLKVKFEYQTGDWSEGIYTKAAGGTLADVFFSADLFVVPFAKNEVSLDLKPLAEADPEVDLNDIFPAMLGLGTFGGQIHFLPSALDVVTMYYNKTIFEQAGAELPQEDWTWEDFIANAQKITEIEKDDAGLPTYWGLSNATWNWWATVYPWIVGYGGLILDAGKSTWSDPKSLAGLQAYTELWTKHNVAQPVGLDVGGDAFNLGRAAVYTHIQGVRTGVRDAVADKFDWDVQIMPTMPDGKHRTGMGTWGLSVYGKSAMKEAGYAFVKQMVTPPIQRLMVKKELAVPLLRSVAEDPTWSEGLKTPPVNFMAYVKGADDAILPIMDYPADCGIFYAGEVATTYQGALEAVIRGTKGVEEAFKEADETIQTCLNENM
jgi:multiple sugar transport system substrate-binding protein